METILGKGRQGGEVTNMQGYLSFFLFDGQGQFLICLHGVQTIDLLATAGLHEHGR